MKALSQVEPRTDVLTLSGDLNNQYIISQPGSYYLSSNLVGAAFKKGISIQANNVALDLRGFSVLGLTNSSDGISNPNFQTNLTVINGTVSGCGSGYGVYCANVKGGHFSGLLVANNLYGGLYAGHAALVEGCTAQFNGGEGIFLYDDGIVTHCNAIGNGASYGPAGIRVSTSCRVEGNSADRNIVGIQSDSGYNLIIRNFAYNNSLGSSNYVYTANDFVGPVITSTGIIATNNPWSNFSR